MSLKVIPSLQFLPFLCYLETIDEESIYWLGGRVVSGSRRGYGEEWWVNMTKILCTKFSKNNINIILFKNNVNIILQRKQFCNITLLP